MNNWIEWKGGACPVDADSLVDVRFRTGEDDHGAEARQWSWSLSHDGDDIIAYRLHHSEQKEAKLNGWIKCSDRMPISKMEADEGFESIDVIVTDGLNVGTCECQAGFLPTPWVNFTAYGDISPSRITHWRPLPTPPEER